MPQFDLRGITVGGYTNNGGTITYSDVASMGDAMTANLEMKFAEGRLYAESSLAEYMRKITGGTISIGVKYIPDAVKPMMFGGTSKSRSVGGSGSVTSIVTKGSDTPKYVGVGFYAPDMIDGVEKYTCVFVYKALFGEPSYSLQTAGDSVQFSTPTTTGEFLPDDSADKNLKEVAVADSEADAKAWIKACFGSDS